METPDRNGIGRSGPQVDAPGFPDFTFAKAPKSSYFMAHAKEHKPSTSVDPAGGSHDFRRSSQQRQSLQTPRSSLLMEHKPYPTPMTPQSPDIPPVSNSTFSTNSFPAFHSGSKLDDYGDTVMDKSSVSSSNPEEIDEQTKHSTPDSTFPMDASRTSTTLIQERIARMKSQAKSTTGRPLPPTRPFAKLSQLQPTFTPQDVFKSKPILAAARPMEYSTHPFTQDSHSGSHRASLPTLIPKSEPPVESRSPTPDQHQYMPIRSKSVLGGRSLSIESGETRGLPAVLAEAMASAQSWGVENQAMVSVVCVN